MPQSELIKFWLFIMQVPFNDITPLDTDNFSTGANITTQNASAGILTTTGAHKI